ncbi:MAG: YkgJ family cysteine cluster protein [Planctomycetaceae bacterium]
MSTVTEEFLCARCARHQKTCCQQTDIFVTLGDIDRIAQHTGQSASQFSEFRAADDPVYLDQDDDPTWKAHVFRSDGTRRVLRQQANRDCTFLGAEGCTLPLETRPLICRLYPFDYTDAGVKPLPAGGCPVELLRPQQQLLPTLDMKFEDAYRWHEQLYRELQLSELPA